LREGGSETELTRALGSVFATDSRLASAFVRLVLERSPHGQAFARALPAELDCRLETTLAEGRVDLEFVDTNDRWHVLVELKIHAGYGHEQIRRYLRSFRDEASQRVLVAITRDVPRYGDLTAGVDPRWAGSVQWARLLDGLRMLKPRDARLAEQWPLFLDVLESEGSMGFTKADINLLRAWHQAVPARGHVADLMETIRRPLLEALRDELSRAADNIDRESLAGFEVRGRVMRAVFLLQREIQVRFRIPAAGPTRIFVSISNYWDDHLRLHVKTPYPVAVDPAAAATAVGTLKDNGFRSWRDQFLERLYVLDDELLLSPTLPDELIKRGLESFQAIVHSGLLVLAPVPTVEQEEPASTDP
jgi:hypothetical protein